MYDLLSCCFGEKPSVDALQETFRGLGCNDTLYNLTFGVEVANLYPNGPFILFLHQQTATSWLLIAIRVIGYYALTI